MLRSKILPRTPRRHPNVMACRSGDRCLVRSDNPTVIALQQYGRELRSELANISPAETATSKFFRCSYFTESERDHYTGRVHAMRPERAMAGQPFSSESGNVMPPVLPPPVSSPQLFPMGRMRYACLMDSMNQQDSMLELGKLHQIVSGLLQHLQSDDTGENATWLAELAILVEQVAANSSDVDENKALLEHIHTLLLQVEAHSKKVQDGLRGSSAEADAQNAKVLQQLDALLPGSDAIPSASHSVSSIHTTVVQSV